MRKLSGILSLARHYTGYAVLNVIFNILSAIFSLFSVTMIIPFLRVLFRSTDELAQVPERAFHFSTDGFTGWFNYQLAQRIADNKTGALLFLCVVVVVLFFIKNLCRYLAHYYLAWLRNGVVRDLRQSVYRKMLRLPLSFFSEQRKGDVMARLSSDVQEVEWSIMNTLDVLFREPVMIILYLVTLLVISPQLTLFIVIMIAFAGAIIGYTGQSLRRVSARGQEKLGSILSVIEESLAGLRIIHAFNAEKHQHLKFSRENDQHFRIVTRLLQRRDLASPLSEFLGICVVAVVLLYGGSMVLKGDGPLSPETFIGFILIFSQMLNPAKFFSSAYYNIRKGLASLDRINQILQAEETIRHNPEAKAIASFDKSIEYRSVSFAYEQQTVLSRISFELKKGKTLALVGPSGAGKTTLMDLLPRFYDVSSGSVMIDGTDIRNYKLHDLRSLFGVVTQEPILFNDTIFNNIAFGLTGVSTEDVERAAGIANAHSFIMQTEQGYHTVIGDRGHKLSGGERQRITIARAVLRNPAILLLDEATSSLDSESEKLVQDALSRLMQNRTTIVIAHRLSTIQAADEILVLNRGEIAERGNHEALMNLNGIYRNLVEMQSL
jgi:subfamily B ATP-binding cassette protein MsbA